ncbi:18662_t:CDS:1, partial [Gigaspora rosea]
WIELETKEQRVEEGSLPRIIEQHQLKTYNYIKQQISYQVATA